ncbi:MAG: hypothetical protein IKH43_03780 [Bacteroidaceae bacterium]|nr:hypothetical protein [Bacteroidaceae bacterium]
MAKLRNNFETAMTNGFDFGCPPIFLDEAKIFVWFCEKIVNGKWLNGLFFVPLHVKLYWYEPQGLEIFADAAGNGVAGGLCREYLF